jgi:hypothetical protein
MEQITQLPDQLKMAHSIANVENALAIVILGFIAIWFLGCLFAKGLNKLTNYIFSDL